MFGVTPNTRGLVVASWKLFCCQKDCQSIPIAIAPTRRKWNEHLQSLHHSVCANPRNMIRTSVRFPSAPRKFGDQQTMTGKRREREHGELAAITKLTG